MDRKRPPLRQGTDPAESLYQDQVRRDTEAAHRYLEKIGKPVPTLHGNR